MEIGKAVIYDKNHNEIGKITTKTDCHGKTWYDLIEMRNLVKKHLGFDDRGCENTLAELGFDIPYDDFGNLVYCNFWHYQVNLFRRYLKNNSRNSLYVGTVDGVDYEKIKKLTSRDTMSPGLIKHTGQWTKFFLDKWNELFGTLADQNGWIRIYARW